MNSAFDRPDSLPLIVLLMAVCAVAIGCSSESGPVTSAETKYQVADDGASAPAGSGPDVSAADVPMGSAAGQGLATPEKPSLQPPAGGALDQPRSNRPEDLIAFIQNVNAQDPTGLTRAEMIADLRQKKERVINAADQVLVGQASGSQQRTAAREKLMALAQLVDLDAPSAHERLTEFCLELEKHGDAELVQLGRRASFEISVNKFAQGSSRDAQALVQEFKVLVENEEKDARLLAFASEIASILQENEMVPEALEILDVVVDAFGEVQNPGLAARIGAIKELANLIEADFQSKFIALLEGEPGAIEAFLDASRTLLTDPDAGNTTLVVLLQQAAPQLEYIDLAAATELYAMIEQAYGDHENEEIAALVKQEAEYNRRRAALVGAPFAVEGLTVDGQPFDWNAYQGKVVLIDFWATWCQPCLDEIPNIRSNYELYRNQGFEVVGVNLDDDEQDVRLFFSRHQLPWPTVVDPEALGMANPLAQQSGVSTLPFIVLVGRDGKVAALNVRGEELGPKLAELLAAPEVGGEVGGDS